MIEQIIFLHNSLFLTINIYASTKCIQKILSTFKVKNVLKLKIIEASHLKI